MSALTLMTAKAANDWAIATNFMIDELKVYLLTIMMYVVVWVLVYVRLVRLQIGQDQEIWRLYVIYKSLYVTRE